MVWAQCIKACPNESVGLFLRPPAFDISSGSHEASLPEVFLLFLLMGNIFMRHLGDMGVDTSSFYTHALASLTALAAPLMAAFSIHSLAPFFDGAPLPGEDQNDQNRHIKFIDAAYGFLPLCWAANLAHWSALMLREDGHFMPIIAATFGMEAAGLPSWTISPDVLGFLQGSLLIGGGLMSVILTGIISRRGGVDQIAPQVMSIIAMTVALGYAVLGH